MSELKAPDWLLKTETRARPKDRAIFLRKTSDALAYALKTARRVDEPERRGAFRFSTQMKLALALTIVTLVPIARNFAFVEIVCCALLLYLSTLDAKRLARVLAAPLQATLLSLVILAPSLLWGQTRALIATPCKTFATTTALALLAYSTNWNRFTCAFKSFGTPDAVIFIFDLTLKYVVVLCEISLETLEAARLRSVGRNRRKARTIGGIAGTAFLRAQKFSQEQFDAMTCRCFSGKYKRFHAPFRKADLLGALLVLAILALFVYLEIAIRCSN